MNPFKYILYSNYKFCKKYFSHTAPSELAMTLLYFTFYFLIFFLDKFFEINFIKGSVLILVIGVLLFISILPLYFKLINDILIGNKKFNVVNNKIGVVLFIIGFSLFLSYVFEIL